MIRFETTKTTEEQLEQVYKSLRVQQPETILEKLEEFASTFYGDYCKHNPNYKQWCGEYLYTAILQDLSTDLFDLFCYAYAKSCFDDGVLFKQSYVKEHYEFMYEQNPLRYAHLQSYIRDMNMHHTDIYFTEFFKRAYREEHIIAKREFLDKARPSWYDDDDCMSRLRFVNQIKDYAREIINEEMTYKTPFSD